MIAGPADQGQKALERVFAIGRGVYGGDYLEMGGYLERCWGGEGEDWDWDWGGEERKRVVGGTRPNKYRI